MTETLQKHIFLIGFMGSGKSSIGRKLVQRFGCALVEMDQEIEKQQGMTINEIFAEKGEEGFRQIETEYLAKIAGMAPCVVSCGGGVVLREQNVACMKDSGTVVYLTAAPETILSRVGHSTHRPLLNGHMNVEYIAGMMEKRRPSYERAADLIIATDGKDTDTLCSEIADKIFAG